MHILFLVLLICVLILLWAAFSVARHIQDHRAERKGIQAATGETLDQEAQKIVGTVPTAKIAEPRQTSEVKG